MNPIVEMTLSSVDKPKRLKFKEITSCSPEIALKHLFDDIGYGEDELSDENMKTISHLKSKTSPKKYIKALIDGKEKLSPYDAMIIMKTFKDYDGGDVKYAPYWKDDVLDGYCNHIKNYRYHYKDEATAVDPRVDTETEHIGPMAQDIEKVNPAAVTLDETGYKKVDTGRLALMNAGAIAELARELKELTKK